MLGNSSKLILNIPDAVRFSRGGAGCPYLPVAETNRTLPAQAMDSPQPLLLATARGGKGLRRPGSPLPTQRARVGLGGWEGCGTAPHHTHGRRNAVWNAHLEQGSPCSFGHAI